MAALTVENKYETTALSVTGTETCHCVGSVSPHGQRFKCDIASTMNQEICVFKFIVPPLLTAPEIVTFCAREQQQRFFFILVVNSSSLGFASLKSPK